MQRLLPLALLLLLPARDALGQAQPAAPAPATAAATAAAPSRTIAITNVTVVDVSDGRSRSNMTVLLRGDRIVDVGASRFVKAPAGARIVDGTGRFLMPGLWDMHVHSAANAQRELPMFLAFGVTGVRNMHTTVDTALALTNSVRRRVRAGTLVGPRFIAGGPALDGPEPARRGMVAIDSESDARRAVDSLVRGGAEFIKVYNQLGRDAYFAVLEQAKARRVPVVGHVPFWVRAEEASKRGQRSMEHLDGLDFACSSREDSLRANLLGAPSRELWQQTQGALTRTWNAQACAQTIEAYRQNGTWQVPTLVVGWAATSADSVLADSAQMALVPAATRSEWRAALEQMPAEERAFERDWLARKLETTRLLHRAGVPIMAGSDVGNPFLIPGFSLHQELALLVQAGLTPLEALKSATLVPARFLQLNHLLGSIAPGKLADLVLLDEDPLLDVANAQRIRAVFASGRYLTRTQLDAMLREPTPRAAPRATTPRATAPRATPRAPARGAAPARRD